MIYLAHQLDAIGIPGELFLERYADWEVELPNGATIRAITEQGLLNCGFKREAQKWRLRSQEDGGRENPERMGKNRGGRPRAASKTSLDRGESGAARGDSWGHDNTIPFPTQIRK